eukprot:scaffold18076_cov33-Phaeocystis_antarctica.AAC.5
MPPEKHWESSHSAVRSMKSCFPDAEGSFIMWYSFRVKSGEGSAFKVRVRVRARGRGRGKGRGHTP